MAACSSAWRACCARAGCRYRGMPHGTLTLFVGVSLALLWAACDHRPAHLGPGLAMTRNQRSPTLYTSLTNREDHDATQLPQPTGHRSPSDCTGALGPALVLVGGAFSYPALTPRPGPSSPTAGRPLHRSYKLRTGRGRGDSGDYQPLTASRREIEDPGRGDRGVAGRPPRPQCGACSSGAVLALDAAAAGVRIHRLGRFRRPPSGG